MKSQQFQIIVPSVSLRKTKNKINIIDTQLLFGETFKVEFFRDDWAYGFNAFDNYKGWISKDSLGFLPEFNYIISNPRSVVTSEPNVRSSFIQYLPLASRISVEKFDKNWAKIILSDKHQFHYGFISSEQVTKKKIVYKNWVKIAESLIGTPYRWGGRDSLGLDCSSLLQLSVLFKGYSIPRDTKDQIKYFKKSPFFSVLKKNQVKNMLRGDIIYWKGHVGILVDNKNIIHSSASHGFVLLELLDEVQNRIKTKYIIIRSKEEL